MGVVFFLCGCNRTKIHYLPPIIEKLQLELVLLIGNTVHIPTTHAGGQRVAQRTGNGPARCSWPPSAGGFSDHLGSTALVTNGSMELVSEMRYNPWGGGTRSHRRRPRG